MTSNHLSYDEGEDFYLSDIHVETENIPTDETGVRQTRIEYVLPEDLELLTKPHIEQDLDGDLVVARKSAHTHVLIIEHSMHTTLDMVGLQLWRASFFMCDFLLDNAPRLLKHKTVVEFGAGLGLASLFCSMYAERVFCTDLEKIVKQARVNIELNTAHNENILFKHVDWSDHESFFKEPVNIGEYSLNKHDLALLEQASVFFAADVVYDNLITLNFMNTVYAFMVYGQKQAKVCYVANETRINFTTHTLSSTDTAYAFFMECLRDLDEYIDEEHGYKFSTGKCECDQVPFYVRNYKRNAYLSIWKIECTPI